MFTKSLESLPRRSTGAYIQQPWSSQRMLADSSLHQAADNNTTAISLVQTAEGALNEASKLLVDMRQRAVAAANIGLNDENMVNASSRN